MSAITSCSTTVFHSPAHPSPSSSSSSSSSSFGFPPPKFPRLSISHAQIRKVPIRCCTLEQNPDSSKKASIDLKLPRRSLLVSFTCNACGVRSQRLINRLAYERGTVFLQCSGCLQYHKFVDNLELVVEYNLLEDGVTESNQNQI